MTTVAIDAINFEDRHRKDLGDIDGLMSSIDRVGLLQPIAVNRSNKLIAGARRLEAIRRLGWTDAPVVVAESVDSAVLLLEAERDENTCRKAMTPTEEHSLYEALLEFEKAEAGQRKSEAAADSNRARSGTKSHSGEAEAPAPSKPKQRSKEKAAKAVTGKTGSRKKLDKIGEVKKIVADPTTSEAVKEVADKALVDMDSTNNIDGPYRKVKLALTASEMVVKFPELSFYTDRGRDADAVRLGTALADYTEPEMSVRRDALQRSISVEQRKEQQPDPDLGPDYDALAHQIFEALNKAARTLANNGGVDTFTRINPDGLLAETYREQFESMAERCAAIAEALRPKLRRIK